MPQDFRSHDPQIGLPPSQRIFFSRHGSHANAIFRREVRCLATPLDLGGILSLPEAKSKSSICWSR